MVTLLPPTSEAGVRFPARPHMGKLVVAVGQQFTVQNPNDISGTISAVPCTVPILI